MTRVARLCRSRHILTLLRQFSPFLISIYYIKCTKRKEEHAMRKPKNRIQKVLAKIIYKTAENGAGLPSSFGWHQPKVPKKLSK